MTTAADEGFGDWAGLDGQPAAALLFAGTLG
jgi:hypothetical protein